MATPDFILALRAAVGHAPLWLMGVTAVVHRADEVLLVRRSDNGALTPVTGIIDPGEEPAAAAEREVAEETGLVARTEALVWVHALPQNTYANGDVTQYLDIVLRLRCEDERDPHPADGENTEAFWWPVARLDELAGLSMNMRERIRTALDHPASARFTESAPGA